MDMNNVKTILFDSGRTLNAPRTGHWFITPNFIDIIKNLQFSCTNEELNKAMEKACEHISQILLVESEEEEFSMFMNFYEIVL